LGDVSHHSGRATKGLLLTGMVASARSIALGLVVLGFITGPTRDAGAQADNRTLRVQVNVPYAVQFGFGSYEVGGLSVDVFRVPVTKTVALGTWGDAWQLAVTGYPGYGHFESRVLGPKITTSEDVAFLLLHTELQIPLRRWWTVKPYVEAGLGRTFGGSVDADGRTVGRLDEQLFALYAAGISNLFEVRVQDFLLSFGTKLAGAGTPRLGSPRVKATACFRTAWKSGIRSAFASSTSFPTSVSPSSTTTSSPSAKFSLPGRSPLEVSNQFEFGVSIGSAVPATLWIFENPRIGVSYRFGDGLTGVRVNFGFPS
jgi:hypothetical protein